MVGFMDLEKGFERVPRDVIRWAMRKLGAEEWLCLCILMHKKVVRTVYGNSNCFEVKVCMHQDESFAICDCHGSFI